MNDFDALKNTRPGPFLVYTDLDGTLLDHISYDWKAAASAIERLEAMGCPLILNSSKTAAEMRDLRIALNNRHPFIAENGAVIAFPEGYPTTHGKALDTIFLGQQREAIINALHLFRQETGAQFSAFSDMSIDEICRHTLLPPEDAERAAQRQATEPMLWQDSEALYHRLEAFLHPLELRLLRGGRFIHVMGRCDKATAMSHLTAYYRDRWAWGQPRTIALGDSPNDRDMLNTADIAVIMAATGEATFDANGQQQTLYAGGGGPEYWNETIHRLLNSI